MIETRRLKNVVIFFQSISDKNLKNRAYEIDRNTKCDGYQKGLATMMHNVFDKKTGSRASEEELAQQLRKPVIKKFK